eukprot:2592081-Rhodomonas_salina.1
MEARRKLNEANAAFVQKAKDVFDRYDTEGSGHVDAWEVKKALKEMGHEISDEIIFSMLRSSETEHTIVNFEKFLTVSFGKTTHYQVCLFSEADRGPAADVRFKHFTLGKPDIRQEQKAK